MLLACVQRFDAILKRRMGKIAHAAMRKNLASVTLGKSRYACGGALYYRIELLRGIKMKKCLWGYSLGGVLAAVALPSVPVGAQGAVDDGAVADGTSVPEVGSKADYLALDRPERWEYSRANRPRVGYFFEAGGEYSGPSQIDGTDTEVSVARLRGGGGLAFRLDDTTDLILRAGSEVSYYEFDGVGRALIPGMPGVTEPFDAVHTTTFTPILRSLPETGWRWTVGGGVTWAGEGGADFGDSIIGGGFGLASYDVTKMLRIGAGVSVVTRLDGGVFVFPIPVIEWDITSDLQLTTTQRGIALTHFIDEAWSLGAEVGFTRREYRLADDNQISGGSFTDWRVPVTLIATYSPSPKTIISARVGSDVLGEMEFNDRNGNELANRDLGATLLVGFDLRISF